MTAPANADISTEVTFEDGRKGTLAARVTIHDMQPVAPPGPAGEGGMRPQTDRHASRRTTPCCRSTTSRCRSAASKPSPTFPSISAKANPRHHRAERRRQNVDAQYHQRILSSAAGHPSPSRAKSRSKNVGRTTLARWRHHTHFPECGVVPWYDRARQHHGRPHAQDETLHVPADAARRPGAAPRRSSIATGSRRSSTSSRSRKSAARRSAGFPTACRSASNSAARSPWSRICCCSTSRWLA